jgi:hypothetical protein
VQKGASDDRLRTISTTADYTLTHTLTATVNSHPGANNNRALTQLLLQQNLDRPSAACSPLGCYACHCLPAQPLQGVHLLLPTVWGGA